MSAHPNRPKGQSRQYYVYVMTNIRHSSLYIGVTNDLYRRVYEHKNKLTRGFSSRYNTTMLMHYETTEDVYSAIAREKQLKGWTRRKKDDLINLANPRWADLSRKWY